MDRLATLLYSILAQLVLMGPIAQSNVTSPACSMPTFQNLPDQGMTRCFRGDIVENCVENMTRVFVMNGNRLKFSALNRAVKDCVDVLSENLENENMQVDCIAEVCSKLNESATASSDPIPPLVCTQEFVNVIVAGDVMNRTGVGRLVNHFIRMCRNEQQMTAANDDDADAVVNECMRKYVGYCFGRESTKELEECIDEVDFVCDTIDDAGGRRQCREAAEEAVGEELTARCSRGSNLEICETLFREILDDHSTPDDIAMLAAVIKGLAQFENMTDLFLELTEQLFTNLTTTNNTYRLVDVNDAEVFLESFDTLLDHERILGVDKYTKKQSKGSSMLRNLEMLSSVIAQNLLSYEGRLNSNFSYGGTNMMFSVHISNSSKEEPYKSPGIQSDDGDNGDATIELPTCYLCSGSTTTPTTGTTEPPSYSERCTQTDIDEDCQSVVVSLAMNNIGMLLEDSSNSTQNRTVVGAVISSQVIQRDEDEGSLRDRRKGCDVVLNFTTPVLQQNSNYTKPICYFWDFDIGEYGAWSSEGVDTTAVSNTSVICSSTHLTSFAVLFDTQGVANNLSKVESEALSFVGYIGSGISLVSLVVTIGFLIVFHKKLNRGSLLYIHLNFCIALALALLLLLIGLQTATSVRWLCGVVAGLLHYLFLAVFCWMLCEGIMLYLLVVQVFGSAADKWYLLTPLGWGLPVLVVAITAAIRPEQYGHYSNKMSYCWLSTDYGVVWSFVGPVIAIICVNSVILLLTVAALVKGRKKGGAETNVKRRQLVVSAVKGIIILLPLLGITWIVGVFAVNRNTSVFLWIFTIFNSLQGLAIFLLHVIRSHVVLSFVYKSVIKPLSTHRSRHSSATKDVMTKDFTTKEDPTDDKLHDKIEMADLQHDNS